LAALGFLVPECFFQPLNAAQDVANPGDPLIEVSDTIRQDFIPRRSRLKRKTLMAGKRQKLSRAIVHSASQHNRNVVVRI
jgi:hypothetical protein